MNKEVFEELVALYERSLKIDSADVEANFNVGLLHLQVSQDMQAALAHFQRSVLKDVPGDRNAQVFRS